MFSSFSWSSGLRTSVIFWKRVWKGRPWSRGESRVPNVRPCSPLYRSVSQSYILESSGVTTSMIFWNRVWKVRPWSRGDSRVPNSRHCSLFQSRFFGESRFLGSSQIPYPVNVSRIPHCIMVKSRIPGWLFQTRLKVKHCHVLKTSLFPRLLIVKTRPHGY